MNDISLRFEPHLDSPIRGVFLLPLTHESVEGFQASVESALEDLDRVSGELPEPKALLGKTPFIAETLLDLVCSDHPDSAVGPLLVDLYRRVDVRIGATDSPDVGLVPLDHPGIVSLKQDLLEATYPVLRANLKEACLKVVADHAPA